MCNLFRNLIQLRNVFIYHRRSFYSTAYNLFVNIAYISFDYLKILKRERIFYKLALKF